MIIYRIKLILKKFLKNKVNFIIILLIGICFAFSILVNSLSYSAAEYFKDNVLNFVSYRQFMFFVDSEEEREQANKLLKSMPEVETVFDDWGYLGAWYVEEIPDANSKNKMASITLMGTGSEVKSIVGEDLSHNKNEASMVCPNSFYLDDDLKNKFDLTDYVGKTLTLKFIKESKTREFSVKLEGLFDNDRLNKFYSKCYIDYGHLTEMMKYAIDVREETLVHYEIKNAVYEEKVNQKLMEAGFYPTPIISMNKTLAVESIDLLIYINYGLFIITLFIISCLILYRLNKNKSVIMMNKIHGYTNKNLILDYFVEMTLIFILSIIFMSLISIVFLSIFRRYLKYIYPSFKYVKVLISPNVFASSVLLLLCLCFLISLISYFSTLKNQYAE